MPTDEGSRMTNEVHHDKAALERQLTRLTTERTALFAQAGTLTGGLSKEDQSRLTSVERQIDECYLEIRRDRAAREARRFTAEGLMIRRGVNPRPADGRRGG
jgi:hypothetical protein